MDSLGAGGVPGRRVVWVLRTNGNCGRRGRRGFGRAVSVHFGPFAYRPHVKGPLVDLWRPFRPFRAEGYDERGEMDPDRPPTRLLPPLTLPQLTFAGVAAPR
jgi:hypothetical protein